MRQFIMLVLILQLLLGCATLTDAPETIIGQFGGGSTPEDVAEGFFEDLGVALADQRLREPDVRDAWVERLASYFAPNERVAQRALLRTNLDLFASNISRLPPDEELSLEIRFEQARRLSDDGSRAVVELPNATVHMIVIRTTDRGQVIAYDQSRNLNELIGRGTNSVPVIRVGDRWFLTED